MAQVKNSQGLHSNMSNQCNKMAYETAQAFAASIVDYASNDTDMVEEINADYDSAIKAIEIEKTAKKIAKTTRKLFWCEKEARGNVFIRCSKLGEEVLSAIETDFRALEESFPLHQFNPFIETFVREARDSVLGITKNWIKTSINNDARLEVEQLNNFVDRLKNEYSSKEFNARLNVYVRAANKRHRSLKRHIDDILQRHPNLLVCRIDLRYKKTANTANGTQKTIDIGTVRKHREQLIRELKERFFKESWVSHAWKLEYGQSCGWHYHLLVFFSARIVNNDMKIARIIGKIWENKITKGVGVYFNCNASKFRYKSLGIGRINRKDEQSVNNLKSPVAAYLAKADFYAKIVTPGIRTFGKGILNRSKITLR